MAILSIALDNPIPDLANLKKKSGLWLFLGLLNNSDHMHRRTGFCREEQRSRRSQLKKWPTCATQDN
ncbi:hypothetical protein BpHYR1_032135 [Brachionus plicatilis]|uniref:Uncharacterized protein n=1 Tax=Brachionus plicatilis TaxID=10195 RepID=A0A3M7QMV0_BRAPC|nr:hypothetical protein BpHYR1_032135 [Brachionus plicatilis]